MVRVARNLGLNIYSRSGEIPKGTDAWSVR